MVLIKTFEHQQEKPIKYKLYVLLNNWKLGMKLGKLGNAYKKSCTVLLPTVFFKGCILILKNLTTGT